MSLFEALVSLDASLTQCDKPTVVLHTMLELLPTLLPCAPRAVATIDEETLLPAIVSCMPPEAGADMQARLDAAVAHGLFALALRRGQPAIDDSGAGHGLILQAIATPSHVAGLLIGVCNVGAASTEALAALSLAAARAGAAHENLILRHRVLAHNAELEQRVAERTRDLAAARDRAEAALRTKSVFLTTMSHELRTPLNGIIGMADLVLADRGEDERVQVMRTSAEDLLRQIDGILNLSRLEAGRLEPTSEEANPAEIAIAALRILSPAAQGKGLALVWKATPEFPSRCLIDPGLLRQVLVNLAGNAIKFTDHGGVTINGSAEETANGWRLVFAVADTGPGIPPEIQARLFTSFEQGDASIRRKFGGTGLGLVISRQLCELLGGGLTLASVIGSGSTFSATITAGRSSASTAASAAQHWAMAAPVKPSTAAFRRAVAAQPAQPANRRFAAARVLCADDQEVNRLVLSGQLRLFGVDARMVSGGAEAVESALTESWDLILLDCQMPEVDGFMAVRRIRDGGCRTPLVAVTAHAVAGNREECLARGFDDYVAKPVRPAALEAMLNRWLATVTPAATSTPLPSTATSSRIAELRHEIGDETLQAVIQAMLADGARLVREAGAALATGDLATASKRAHALKGDSANLGLDALSAVAKALEHAAKAGDAATAAAAGARLPAAWAEAEGVLRGAAASQTAP
ncbi:MAG: ATP-binding protein [Planctomycetota bacterium]